MTKAQPGSVSASRVQTHNRWLTVAATRTAARTLTALRSYRVATRQKYRRICNRELVKAVQRIAGNGTGDMRWKAPGALDWSTGTYNPRVDTTRRVKDLTDADMNKALKDIMAGTTRATLKTKNLRGKAIVRFDIR